MEKKIEVLTNINPDLNRIPSADPPYILECALKTNADLYYVNLPVLIFVLFGNNKNKLTLDDYQKYWKNLPQTQNNMTTLNDIKSTYHSVENVQFAFYFLFIILLNLFRL
jgi:hypothetical protein